jgi:exodeoxyribonuclease-3
MGATAKIIKIATWNVNGIRACVKNGFVDWLIKCNPDVVLLQEVRADESQIPAEVVKLTSYHQSWFAATSRKGYSGTGVLSKVPVLSTKQGLGIPEIDAEGRVLTCEMQDFFVVSAYFPNSQDAGKRIQFKIAFCSALEKYISALRMQGKPVVLGGDFNIAHRPMDLARPAENEGTAGYLPEERAWMEHFVHAGWVDSFRAKHPDLIKYSWWSARTGARARNVGWRIDYNVVHESDRDRIAAADIEDQVLGSDHCPVILELRI